ncbi:MAG: DUF3466 family protein [Phycisphaerales bacterium]|nr:DUF3466 family protein [Phycisphaerales bacterium]
MLLNQNIKACVVLLFACAAQAVAQDYRYAVFELPSLTTQEQWAGTGGINSIGDVVGFTLVDANYIHAVLWPHDGGVVDLGTLGGDYSAAASINDRGEIVGWAGFRPGSGIYVRHAFLWRDGEMSDLGTLGGESSVATGVNAMGQIVGESEYEFGNYSNVGFVWQAGQMQVLDDPWPDRNSSDVWGVNDRGQIVGAGLSIEGTKRAMLWINEQPIDLGALTGFGSSAYAINDAGDVVGLSEAANGAPHAVKWTDQQIIDIHTPSIGLNSSARGINNLGQVVGDNHNVIRPRAFILNPGEDMIFLDDLVPPRLRIRWRITRVNDINDFGQIPATADVPSNPADTWALLLTPVNPTMSLQSPVPGSAGTTNRLRATGATPGSRVYFCYSRRGGGTRIPGCDLQQNALQLDSPTIIGSAIADANGVAAITRTVPLIARGQTILFQAVVQNECAISQLVVWEFQ